MRPSRTAKPLAILALSLAGTLALPVVPTTQEAQAGPSARDIMDKVAVARKLDGSEAVVSMSIINAKGQSRDRKLSMATKLFDDGKTEKRIYRFLSPADVEGTGVLVYDYETKADDVWVYLPALRKTRRVVSSQKSQSFMGSEFSYGDLNIPALDDFTYKLVKEETFDGDACWVIDVTPKDEKTADSEGYSKKTYWVSKDHHAVRRGLYYDMDGELLKELLSKDIKLLDPKKKRYRAMHMEMVNKQNGRRSVFKSEKVAFSPNTKDEFFTSRYLERS